jgi:hypothetical protein
MTEQTPGTASIGGLEDPSARSTKSAFKRLTAEEAGRALYIDFEGQTDRAPVLLGTLRRRGRADEPSVFQLVVDPEFEAAGPALRGLREAVEVLVVRAEARDRRIVSWSEHDLEVVRRLRDEDPDLVARFERRYVNALAVARRWVNRLHPEDKPAGGELVGYLAMIDYEVPPGAGPGNVGDTIRALRPALAAGRPLTPRQKARWTHLLRHNQHDCAGMREICLRATRELVAAEAEA